MKKLPHLLAAAALIGGTAALAAFPADAKKKEEAAPAGGLVVSKELRALIVPADAAIQAHSVETAEPLVVQIEAGAKTDDERYIAQAMRLNVEKLKLSRPGSSEQSLKGPLDALIANAKTPPADQATYNYQRAALAFNARDYKGSLAFIARAKQLGSTEPNLALLEARAKIAAGDVTGGSAALDQAFSAQTSAGAKPDEQLYRYAIAQNAKATNGGQAALPWIEKYVVAYSTKKNWRDMTVAWGIQGTAMTVLEKREKLDLFRMLRAGNALADEYDYETYAHWAIDVGLPYEAKTVIAEGQRAGKIPAGNADVKQLLAQATSSIANDGTLTSLETRGRAGTGRLALAAADANLGSDNYAKAADLYRVALTKGGVGVDADAVNLRLGVALARSGDKEGARAAFATVKAWPFSGVAGLWTTFLDNPPSA